MAENMMKVLVSLTQEAFDQYSFLEDQTALFDFNWTDDAMEILTLPTIVCDGPPSIRMHCGCGRSFGSIDTCKVTTLGLVTYAQIDALKARLRKSKQVESWGADLFDDFWKQLKSIGSVLEAMELSEGTVVRIQSEPDCWNLYSADELYGPRDVLDVLTDEQKAIMT